MPPIPTRSASPLQLRPARQDDFISIIDLVGSPGELFLAFPAARWPLDFRQLRRLAEERLELTVACNGKQVIGFANVYRMKAGEYAFIGNLLIHPDHRGKGLGRALLNHMLRQLAGNYALPEARISVFSHNDAALHLYRSLGFTTYGREVRSDPQGTRVILLHMQRTLKPGGLS